VSHTQPISLYIDAAATHTGRPNVHAYRDDHDGSQRVRIRLTGSVGPFLSLSVDDWDILAAAVAEARAEAAAATQLPGHLPTAHLNRT
jgi:hypothetical protein